MTILRFANVLGPDVRTSHIGLFSLPAVPMILGFDPRYQFVHEDDVVPRARARGAVETCRASTTWPATACWRSARSSGLLGKPYAPILPPWGTGLAAGPLRRLGLQHPAGDAEPAALRPRARQPPLQGDRLPLRLHQPRDRDRARRAPAPAPAAARRHEPYRYEREVEEFLRWSPHVRGASAARTAALTREQLAAAAPAAARGRARQRRAGASRRRRGPARPKRPRRARRARSSTTTTSRPRRSSRCSARSSRATWSRCATTSATPGRAERCSARSTPCCAPRLQRSCGDRADGQPARP